MDRASHYLETGSGDDDDDDDDPEQSGNVVFRGSVWIETVSAAILTLPPERFQVAEQINETTFCARLLPFDEWCAADAKLAAATIRPGVTPALYSTSQRLACRDPIAAQTWRHFPCKSIRDRVYALVDELYEHHLPAKSRIYLVAGLDPRVVLYYFPRREEARLQERSSPPAELMISAAQLLCNF
jgi:hypothetical protein